MVWGWVWCRRLEPVGGAVGGAVGEEAGTLGVVWAVGAAEWCVVRARVVVDVAKPILTASFAGSRFSISSKISWLLIPLLCIKSKFLLEGMGVSGVVLFMLVVLFVLGCCLCWWCWWCWLCWCWRPTQTQTSSK